MIQKFRLMDPNGAFLHPFLFYHLILDHPTLMPPTNLTIFPISPYSYLCRTDPADVARVESKTFLVTPNKHDSVPHVAEGTKGILGQWMEPEVFKHEATARFPGCMKGNGNDNDK